MSEKYSVLMSLYDGENPSYLEPSIDSMLNQSKKADEIVIVLDGPINHQLQAIINSYVNKHPETFVIVPLEQNVGLGKALNEGLEYCSNPLIARMDTDDIAQPLRCEKQLLAFEKNPELSIVGTNTDEFSSDPSKIISSRVVPTTHPEIMKFSKTRNPFNHPTVMYRRDDVINSGGYGDFRRNQDYELFVRMLNEGYKGMNLNESLLLFRANEDNLKRRKSWNKTKGDIAIRYNFYKKGYVDIGSFMFSTAAFLGSYILPVKLFDSLSSNLLREKK